MCARVIFVKEAFLQRTCFLQRTRCRKSWQQLFFLHMSLYYSIYETYLIILTDLNKAYFMIEINNFMIRIKTCVHDHNKWFFVCSRSQKVAYYVICLSGSYSKLIFISFIQFIFSVYSCSQKRTYYFICLSRSYSKHIFISFIQFIFLYTVARKKGHITLLRLSILFLFLLFKICFKSKMVFSYFIVI